jgi:AraC-like DNA-binding protein
MGIAARYLDTELGRWTHTEWRPRSEDPLAWAVEAVWDFEGMAAHAHERVFPSGQLELILQLDDRYLDVLPDGVHPTPVACVTGIQSRPIVVRAPRRPVRVLAVRLHPVGAWAMLGHPLHELTDLTSDLDDLLGRAAAEVAERCAGAGSGIERVSLMMAWLRRRLLAEAACPADPGAQHVAARIAHTAGRASIAALGEETGLSGGRLAALFRQQVGVTPKRLARIHRFHHALGLLSDGRGPLVRVAAEAGYYDQPHMNAEFRALAGLTPRQLLAATRYPHSTSLAESG